MNSVAPARHCVSSVSGVQADAVKFRMRWVCREAARRLPSGAVHALDLAVEASGMRGTHGELTWGVACPRSHNGFEVTGKLAKMSRNPSTLACRRCSSS